MVIRCPNCGTENGDDYRFCKTCSKPLGPAYGVFPALTQIAPPKKSRPAVIAAAVIVGVVLVIILFVVLLALTAPDSRADLRANLSYLADEDYYGEGGTITVNGTIFNYGDKSVGCTVHLRIWDGFAQHDFDVEVGIVHPGDKVPFHWEQYFVKIDGTYVDLKYDLTAT